MQVTAIDIWVNKDRIYFVRLLVKQYNMPLATVPDSAYIIFLDKGKEVPKSKTNTILWSEALHDTMALKNKHALKFVTWGGQTIAFKIKDYDAILNAGRQYTPRTEHDFKLLDTLHTLSLQKIDLILKWHISRKQNKTTYSPEYMTLNAHEDSIIHTYESDFHQSVSDRGPITIRVEVVDISNPKSIDNIDIKLYPAPIKYTPPYSVNKIPTYDDKHHYVGERRDYGDQNSRTYKLMYQERYYVNPIDTQRMSGAGWKFDPETKMRMTVKRAKNK